MTRRRYIVLGDRTSHGGYVTSARGEGRMTYCGKPVACVGDIVSCPKCKGTHRILEGAMNPPDSLDGVLKAVEGCRVSCGAVLISVGQDIGFYDGELGLDAASYKTLQAEGIERKKALEAEAAARKAETTAAKPGEAAAVTAKSTDKEQMKCACGGPHPLKIVGSEVKPIQSYTGELKSPLMMVPKVYAALENVPFSEIRRWAREAAEYHEVPYEIVAVILQQENGQNATNLQKIGQFLERSVTTIIAQGNEEIVPIFSWIGKIFPKVMRAPNGSTGIMNMQRKTLKDTISYTKEKYARPLVPASKSKIDTGYAGRDWEADMYYLAAHVRQLMDRVVMGGGKSCVKGEITLSQVGKTFAAYNGLGKDADNYGNDAMTKLMGAYKGESTLYFYER